MKSSLNNPKQNAEKKSFYSLLLIELRLIALIILFVGVLIQLLFRLINKATPDYLSVFYLIGFGLFILHRFTNKNKV